LSLLVRGRLSEVLIPSRYSVANKLSPFMGLPLSAGRTRGRSTPCSASTAGPHPLGGVVGRLALIDLPADDLAAVEIDDEVEVEKPPLDRAGPPTDGPTPDLAGRPSAQPWRCTGRARGPVAAPVMLFVGLPQHPVERRFRGQIRALIGQAGHDRARRPAGIGGLMAGGQHLGPLLGTELVRRHRALRTGPPIDPDLLASGPALIGPHVQAQFL